MKNPEPGLLQSVIAGTGYSTSAVSGYIKELHGRIEALKRLADHHYRSSHLSQISSKDVAAVIDKPSFRFEKSDAWVYLQTGDRLHTVKSENLPVRFEKLCRLNGYVPTETGYRWWIRPAVLPLVEVIGSMSFGGAIVESLSHFSFLTVMELTSSDSWRAVASNFGSAFDVTVSVVG